MAGRVPLRPAEHEAHEEVKRLAKELEEAEQQISQENAFADAARKDFAEKDAARKAAEEEAQRRQKDANAAAQVVKQINLRCKACEARHRELQAALTKAQDVLAEATDKASAERAESGVSLHFLANEFVPELTRHFPGVDVANKTFSELADMLWDSSGQKFAHKTDFLGHASLVDPSDGEAGVSLTTAIWAKNSTNVDKANLFVSWTWQYKVGPLIEALVEHARRNGLAADSLFLWVCFFTNNQRTWLGRHQDGVAVFTANVAKAQRVVCVLDQYQDSLYFRRLWTLFEVFVACIVLNLKVDLAMMEDGRTQLADARMREIAHFLASIDITRARATFPSDEVAIWKQINDVYGGADMMTAKIKELLLKLLNELLLSM
mmetsp:Transcript_14895/g.37740  ORF Transcript_14895/g.37740 Transcript_14895/m.37740 type:complete len:377 (+) Transcript_14895:3-1133(+)